jgi:hypothetical protein
VRHTTAANVHVIVVLNAPDVFVFKTFVVSARYSSHAAIPASATVVLAPFDQHPYPARAISGWRQSGNVAPLAMGTLCVEIFIAHLYAPLVAFPTPNEGDPPARASNLASAAVANHWWLGIRCTILRAQRRRNARGVSRKLISHLLPPEE